MFKHILAGAFALGFSTAAHASTITLEYSFDATVTDNFVMCYYGSTDRKRFASECSPSAAPSPFEPLDVGATYAGLMSFTYSDAAREILDSATCLIGGLNCNFMTRGLTLTPAAADLNTTSSNIYMGDGWSNLSSFDFGADIYLYQDDSDTPSVFQASLSNVTLTPFSAPAPFAVLSSIATTSAIAPVPLPGGLVLALAGFGAFAAVRRRQNMRDC